MSCNDLRYNCDVISSLEVIWNYMKLNQTVHVCNVIFGCGCSNLDIPVTCAELYKKGYGKKIIFSGGLGKITEKSFQKSEAEVYRDIAIQHGVPSEDILLETKSTNTGDNVRFSKEILEKYPVQSILIVHFATSERRTLATAKAILPDYQLFITSPECTFQQFLTFLRKDVSHFNRRVALLVGDVQRMIVYPQFGWQVKEYVPDAVIEAYYILKKMGFDQYIYSSSDILKLIKKNHLNISDSEFFS